MTLIIAGNNPAQALLFAYLVAALINPDITYMRSRANLLSLFWAILAICSFIAYFSYQWSFGYAAERMGYYLSAALIVGQTCTISFL